MARLLVRAFVLVAGLASTTGDSLHGQRSSLATDSALVRYLRRNDSFFRQLGPCRDAKLVRSNARVETSHGDTIVVRRFAYTATCEIKDEEASDCSYKVDISGTLDTPESATIRRFHWDLECAG
jgi:hypothetical protein